MKFSTIMLVCMLCVSSAFAGSGMTQPEVNVEQDVITISKNALTPEMLAQIKAIQDKAQAVQDSKPWLGIGKEFVTGLQGAVDITKSNVYEFAGTPIGKATVVIVAWKIIGHEIIYMIGYPLAVIFLFRFAFKMFKKGQTEITVLKERIGTWPFVKHTYEQIRNTEGNDAQVIYCIVGVVSCIIATIAMFTFLNTL